ncbi:MAG: hypothetical protein AB1449_14335 [Chloroflexota bacterium]
MFALDRTFRLLRRRRRVPVLQPDKTSVVCPLLDAQSGAPFLVSTRKLRRALAGKQRQVLCKARSPGRENAFFARIGEFVGVDPQAGEYVILTPLVHVLGTRHGEPLIALPPTRAEVAPLEAGTSPGLIAEAA